MENGELKEYLRFNYKERIAMVVLVLLIAGLFAYPFLSINKEKNAISIVNPQKNRQKKANEIIEAKKDFSYTTYQNKAIMNNSKLFYFDPNTISPEDWQKLGLRDRTIKTINNYLSKGGSFRIKEDLKKIYGLHENEYQRLAPYIRIGSSENANRYANNTDSYSSSPKATYGKKEHSVVDINKADEGKLIALPGIGEKLAARIIKFRDNLGGFHSVDQVKDTYGLPDSTFQLVKPFLQVSSTVKKININSATKEELKLHPYIRWNLANAIVEYRNQHGNFKSLDGLKSIALIDEATFKKIAPYLSL